MSRCRIARQEPARLAADENPLDDAASRLLMALWARERAVDRDREDSDRLRHKTSERNHGVALFSKRVELNPLLARFADGKFADARELARVQDSLLSVLQPDEARDIRYIVTSIDKPLETVLVVTGTRLLVGSARSGTMDFSVPDERIGGTSVDRLKSGTICLKIRLLRPPMDLAGGSGIYQGDFHVVRYHAEALVAVAHGIDRIFALEEPAAPAAQTSTIDDGSVLDEAWFISWVNGIEASMTPTAFQATMSAQTPLEATTNGLTKGCEQVFTSCFGMIKANCPPQSLEKFQAQVQQNWLNVTPWGLIDWAVDLDPTNGAARGEWEAAIRQVVQDELGTLRQSIIGGR
jgi:hypothetical protein